MRLPPLVLAFATPCCFAAETRVPPWDARGLGPLPAQGVACLDVNEDGSRVVVGTFAASGDTNVHLLDGDGQRLRSFRVGQRGVASVAATPSDRVLAFVTMTTGAAGDEPLAYFCSEATGTPIGGGNGGTALFHYGEHSNHTGKQLVPFLRGAVTINENQVLWCDAAEPFAKSPFRNLKPTALAVHRSGVVVLGGSVDFDPRLAEPPNLLVLRPGESAPAWTRPVVREVGESAPPEAGAYGRPELSAGRREPLPQRDEPIFAPLSIAVSREADFGPATRVATADYRGWVRWIRSSATGKDENYGTRFQPAKPAVSVYDGAGQLVRRFDPASFARPGWVDLAFLPDGRHLLAFPHSWTCRGLAGQTRLPADDHADTLWLLDVATGAVRARSFPDAIAGVAVGAESIAVSCWNGRLYTWPAQSWIDAFDAPLPDGLDVGGPALVQMRGAGESERIVVATSAGEVLFVQRGEVQRRVVLAQVVPPVEKPWVTKARATPLAKGLWQLPGGRVESDLGGQRVIEAPEGLILIEGHAGLSFASEWAAMEAAGLDPRRVKYVLATHEHGDHAPGAYLWRVVTGAQFVCSREMAYVLQHHLPTGTGYGLHPPVRTDLPIDDDTVLDLAGLKVTALRLPGHTFGSMGWMFERDGRRFVAIGDLIMPDGVLGYAGSVNFSPYQVLASLRKLDGLRVDTILPGHGPVVGPEKYVAAGIEVGTRVGWGKMPAERPDPRFRLSQSNVLVAGFLADAVSADFGDADGDGRPDIALVAPHGTGSVLKVCLNRADRSGWFDPLRPDFEVLLPEVGGPTRVRCLTLNDDRRADFFVAGSSMTALLMSRAKSGEYVVRHVAGQEVHQARLVDPRGDGRRMPLLLGRFSGAQLVTGEWPPVPDAPATNVRLTAQPLVPAVRVPYADLRELDLNGDGRSDWLVNDGRVWLRGADGRMPESPSQSMPVPVAGDWSFASVGDFDGDRRPDAVLVSYGMQRRRVVSVFRNTGEARPFPEMSTTTFELTSTAPERTHVRDAAAVGDWNGDGRDDLVIALGQDNQVRVFLGSETGLSAERFETIALDFWLHYEHPVALADFDADGRLDLGCFGYTKTGVGAGGPPAAYVWLRR